MTVSSQLASPHDHDHDHDLLEDWPRSSSSSIEEAEQVEVDEVNIDTNTMPAEPEPNTRVSFSETSMLRFYERDEAYTKACSKVDYDLFKCSVLLDARRVKKLISRAPPESTKDSVKFLFENNIIDIADIVGIEHYVLGKGGFLLKARKLHAKKVLQQQHEQQNHQPDDPTESLAKVAKDSSHQSTHHARIRAAVVAA
mmetsp:Transcript_31932/g.41269  ORF Transcript_31932/g.41269 Transcript_31932/m.41269 type:complete len:198 (+) Transcript_31932:184-777(+)